MSRQTFEIASLRVINYLKARGFQIRDVRDVEGERLVMMVAPGKWSGPKTRYIVKRAKENSDIGVRGIGTDEFGRKDPLSQVFTALGGRLPPREPEPTPTSTEWLEKLSTRQVSRNLR